MPPRQAPSARSTEGGSGAGGQGNASDMSVTAPAGKPAPAAAKPQTGYKNASELVKVYELFSDENVAARINAGEAAAAIAADYARMMAPAMQKARTKDAREITKYDISQTAAEEAKAIYGEEAQSKLLGRPLTAPEQASLKVKFDAEFQNRAAKALRVASAFAKSAWGKDLEDGGPREVPPQDMQPQEDTPQEPQEFAKVKSVAGFGDVKAAERATANPMMPVWAPGEKEAFDKYAKVNKINNPFDPRHNYDYVGAFRAGVGRDPATQHFTDQFKLPGHETFSNESQYAKGENAAKAGRWEGDKYIPPDGKDKKAKEAKARIKKGIEAWAGARKDEEVK